MDASFEKASYVGVVEKLSERGYSFHKRLLCIDDGILSYYSKVPPEAEKGNLSVNVLKTRGEKPKLALRVKYIEAVRLLSSETAAKKKKECMFSVDFKQSAVIRPDGKTGPKKDTESSWVFAVKDREIYEKWSDLIENTKNKETLKALDKSASDDSKTIRKKAGFAGINSERSLISIIDSKNIDSYTDPSKSEMDDEVPPLATGRKEEPDNEVKDTSPTKSSFAPPEKAKKSKGVKFKDDYQIDGLENLKSMEDRLREEEERLNKERIKEEERTRREAELKEQQQKKEEEEYLRKKEQEEKKRQERQEKLKIAWEYKLNLLLDENLKAFDSIEERIKSGFQIIKFIGNFRNQAVDLCKSIIDELWLPASERTHSAKELTVFPESGEPPQRIFFINNIIIRITWTERELVEDADQEDLYLYTEKKLKSYNHEFRAMDILNDTLYLLNKKNRDVTYRVPTSVLVDYKGFRCLVLSAPPFNEETLHLGPLLSTGGYRANTNIEDDLKYIANTIHLKEHTYTLGDRETPVNVSLSVFTEVHKVIFTGYDEEKKEQLHQPQQVEGRLTFSEKKNPDCYYFMNVSDIFPVDLDLDAQNSNSLLNRLRPEFLLEYEKPLSADALINRVEGVQNEIDEVEVAEAAIHLRNEIIPQFIKKLDSLDLILVDSASITQAFHCHGINMRYLGMVCKQTNLPHVREVCIVEMIARVIKKVLRKQLRDLILNGLQEEKSPELGNARNKNGLIDQFIRKEEESPQAKGRGKSRNLSRANQVEQDVAECVIDLLNLIFGKGKESTLFWKEIIAPQVQYDYNYDGGEFKKNEISLGGLLHAVAHHCNLNLKFTNQIEAQLGKEKEPFTKAHYEGLKPRSKVFSMHSLDVKSLAERYKQARGFKEYDAAIKSCLIALSIEKLLSYRSSENFEDPAVLGDMAEILFESAQNDQTGEAAQLYNKAYERAQEGIKFSQPFHVEALKCICILLRIHMIRDQNALAIQYFQQAIDYLHFHVGEYHPLHAIVYSILGSYYVEKGSFQDALLLYKSSLVCCTRILGPNHPYTAGVYLDLGNLTLKMRESEEALNYFEKAFYVFQASKGEDSIECANTSYMMATLLILSGKVNETTQAVLHAMRIYERDEVEYVEKIAECCLLVCKIGELKNDQKLTLDYANKIWNILTKTPTERSMYYKSRILDITLSTLIHSLKADKKTFLYKIFNEIVDIIGQENKLDKVYGGGEDTTLQKEYLLQLFQKSHLSKNIQNLLKDIIKTIFQKLEERDDLKSFFRNYRKNLESLEDVQLRESLIDFEKLIFIHGLQYFEDTYKKY